MKYKVRFYREYEIDTDKVEDALSMGRILLTRELGDQKIGAGFIYEIRFTKNEGQGVIPSEKFFSGEIL